MKLRRPITRERIVSFVRRKLALDAHPTAMPSQSGDSPAPPYTHDYARWIRARVSRRAAQYQATANPDLFSLITPVYDTPAGFLKEAAESVFAQNFPFEWAICDNGSTRPETRDALAAIARDPRVKLVRLEENAGIMGGMAAAFRLASGRYVVPMDSDDLLYPDALRVMASCLEQAGWPVLAYSDEDKIHADSVPCSPFFKPDWDPVLFYNCCFIAHLCAISRSAAAAVNAYTDHDARGCHDWDTFTRLICQGHTPVHVPEVLYSWRIHAGSTASIASTAKTYTTLCQQHVLTRFLARRSKPGLFEIRTNPLFGHEGMWYPARLPVAPRQVHAILLATDSPDLLGKAIDGLIGQTAYPQLRITVLGSLTHEHRAAVEAYCNKTSVPIRVQNMTGSLLSHLQDACRKFSDDDLVVIASDIAPITSADWAWYACGMFDLHQDAVACTPRVVDARDKLFSAGEYFGIDGLVGAPDAGRGLSDSGYYGWVFCQRTVSCVAEDFGIWLAGFLKKNLGSVRPETSETALRAWLCAIAAGQGGRVVYSPHIVVRRHGEAQSVWDRQQAAEFLRHHGRVILSERYYPRFMHPQARNGYALALPQERAAVINRAFSCNRIDSEEYPPATFNLTGP